MATITYEDASRELGDIKQEWIILQNYIEENYLHPGRMTSVPMKIQNLVKKENELSKRIKETWPVETPEKISLRHQYEQVQEEFKKAQDKALEVEKRTLGMATPSQKVQIEKLTNSMVGNATSEPVKLKKMRLIVETTEKATTHTFKVLSDTLGPAFRGSNEYKNGEVTVIIEEL